MGIACAATRLTRRGVNDKLRRRAPHWRDQLVADKEKYWGPGPVRLSVGFLDLGADERSLASKILGFMNHWSRHADVEFYEHRAASEATIRIARTVGDGYWSAIGRECERIRAGEPTMNLEGFTETTPDDEFERTVVHEAGHCLGFEHEHLRAEVVANLDEQVVQIWFGVRTGWDPDRIKQEILTPLDESSTYATPAFDNRSVMCYFIPDIACKDGVEVPGGRGIDEIDAAFVSTLYPPPRR